MRLILARSSSQAEINKTSIFSEVTNILVALAVYIASEIYLGWLYLILSDYTVYLEYFIKSTIALERKGWIKHIDHPIRYNDRSVLSPDEGLEGV